MWIPNAQERIFSAANGTFPSQQHVLHEYLCITITDEDRLTRSEAELAGERNTMTPPTTPAPEARSKGPESARSSMAPADVPDVVNLLDDIETARSSIPPSEAPTLDLGNEPKPTIVEAEPSEELAQKPKPSFLEELAERKRRIVLERKRQRQEEEAAMGPTQHIGGNTEQQATIEVTPINNKASPAAEHIRGVNHGNIADIEEEDRELGIDNGEKKAKRPKLGGEPSSARQPSPITGRFQQRRDKGIEVKQLYELSQASRISQPNASISRLHSEMELEDQEVEDGEMEPVAKAKEGTAKKLVLPAKTSHTHGLYGNG